MKELKTGYCQREKTYSTGKEFSKSIMYFYIRKLENEKKLISKEDE
jgi:hypothetical protein